MSDLVLENSPDTIVYRSCPELYRLTKGTLYLSDIDGHYTGWNRWQYFGLFQGELSFLVQPQTTQVHVLYLGTYATNLKAMPKVCRFLFMDGSGIFFAANPYRIGESLTQVSLPE